MRKTRYGQKMVRVGVMVLPETKDALEEHAAAMDTDVSSMLRRLVVSYLSSLHKPKKGVKGGNRSTVKD